MHFRIPDASDSKSEKDLFDKQPKGRKCSFCSKRIELPNAPLPFCSVRCQQLDLANWLDEEYGLPWEGEKDPDELDDPTE